MQPGGGNKMGVIQVDGGNYDVYFPTVTGTTTIYQVYSIQQTNRHCGHVSISDHFSKWASFGMQLGNMVEVSIFLEALGGTGSIDFTTASVVVN